MSTSGSFQPPDNPCPAPMTRAALIALRNASQLRTECHYIITDGPVIGTAGNTSPTTIELHAISANRLSLVAHVQTTFDPDTAWAGEYDIDLGTAGSIQKLTDLWDNTGQDAGVNAPTVHTQIPWHKGSATFRDNFFNTSFLPGWSAAGGTLVGNRIQETTVNLTGKTGGTFSANQIVTGSVTINTPTSNVENNNLNDATVTIAQSAGTFACRNNTFLGGNVTVDAATTVGVLSISNNVIGGASAGYRLEIIGKTGTACTIAGNRLFDRGLLAYDMRVGGSGLTSIYGNEITAGNITLNGAPDHEMGDNSLIGCTVSNGAGTAVKLLRTSAISSTVTVSGTSVLDGGTLTRTTLDSGGFSMDTFDITGGTKTLTANQSDRVRNALGTNLI